MSATESKFKVGDRVRVLAGIPWVSCLKKDATHSVVGIRQDWVHGQQVKLEGYEWDGWYHHSHFASAQTEPQPIRTVTRREIVPGVYGAVDVETDGWLSVKFDEADPTADTLREAAHIFNQIAEVLEEQAAGEQQKEAA